MRDRPVLEKSIEGPVVKYAKRLGYEVVKLNGMGQRALPDRMFLGPEGRVVFIEFKRPGGKPTALQAALHARWKALGHVVHLIDSVEEGKALLSPNPMWPSMEEP